MPDYNLLSDEEKKLKTGFDTNNTSDTSSPDMSNAQKMQMGVQMLQALKGGQDSGGSSPTATGGMIQGGMAGASTGNPYAAAGGAAAGLVTGLLGASAARAEQKRKADAGMYQNMVAIEGDKQARLQSAMANMAQGMGQSLMQNQSNVRL
ncbi:hypothetical protein M0R04_11525 [Candidatus Dojkabacteria bacterium]|jgi:hypothetical protein|nr:hypothetical protein [Candidatus Dojkabacteria bacterium]